MRLQTPTAYRSGRPLWYRCCGTDLSHDMTSPPNLLVFRRKLSRGDVLTVVCELCQVATLILLLLHDGPFKRSFTGILLRSYSGLLQLSQDLPPVANFLDRITVHVFNKQVWIQTHNSSRPW